MDFDLQACMETCSLSQQQINALVQEGYISMDDFMMNRYQDISEMAKCMQVLPVNRRVYFGQVHIMKLKAFLFWIKDRQHRGLPLNLARQQWIQWCNLRKWLRSTGWKWNSRKQMIPQWMYLTSSHCTPSGDGTHLIKNWRLTYWAYEAYLVCPYCMSSKKTLTPVCQFPLTLSTSWLHKHCMRVPPILLIGRRFMVSSAMQFLEVMVGPGSEI